MKRTSIYSGTPTISVVDNRNLEIRILQYNRIAAEDLSDEYILRNTYTASGYLDSSMDPRLFAQYQEDSGTPPNLRTAASLRGEALRTESADAGRKAELFDIEGRPVWLIDANGTQTTLEYDVLGRPAAVFEQQEGTDSPRCRERLIYGEKEADAQANNLRGQLVRHYDTAGRIQTDSFSLAGMPLHQSRQLLKNWDHPGDWSMEEESAWASLLAGETYDTSWRYDAQDRVLAQTDAKGNLQQLSYNDAGQPQAVGLTLQGQAEQRIWNRIEYNAAGQVQLAEAGNGVITEYTYEESTQRLIRKKDSRQLSSGEREVLQDYRYEYDPVGNILSICNEAESVRYFRNQAVAPKRQYAYDALYQLVSSSGRESDALRQQTSLPALITPIPLDDSQYVNYSEKYSYDRAGNLIKLSHNGASQYITNVYVDKSSNRGIWRQGEDIPDIAASFDRAGNQQALFPGRPLEWDARNQLSRVHMVVREGGDNDWEGYLYDSSGMRIVKRSTRKTQTTTQTDTTLYLPGLELRIRQTGDRVTEVLQVITVDEGAGQARVLHWEDGTEPGGIANDQYRYSLNDHLSSSLLEVDGQGQIISKEEFYPYGGTALWTARSEVEASYKTMRYSGKELDATGLYYYGYRYYMPWLGRWLNPDPAGTVDGLNLYRMVRNNPIGLMDPDGNAPINKADYRTENGDLFYGLSGERGRYIKIFDSNFANLRTTEEKTQYPVIIDAYNNKVVSSVLKNYPLKTLGNLMKEPKKYASKIKVPKNLKLDAEKANFPLWADYFKLAEENAKFNISGIFKDVAKKYGSDQYHEWETGSAIGLAPKLLWKRGSKLGLEIAATNQRTKIHFVLDNLNIEQVVTKEGSGGQSITASELRYIYRNRDRLEGRVIFYRNNERLDQAPWQENPGLWSQYQPSLRGSSTSGAKERGIGNFFRRLSMRR
ncbi:toxin [Paenibacillus alvei]|uniref:Toxin n=1 Tax=Paenibacillus alvei TaxID=44250 RepID=A0ABT4H555_PAEAL|nr:RHS repeat-associated core domain-containing protein [Paenibacillus alvei]EJW20245.1 insecticidal toxin complex protein [Paenibacillus alvei DSM 29]MCY7488081.1 toxin [Paenibacillus alvei]MCY9544073.1 toxin [Paenibacillus alvei]MCY9702629.1 toxin [Paenibacillus alvei]MCY9734153.1 toxin [Paenibacillus alvei]